MLLQEASEDPHLIGIVEDITEHRSPEENLRAAEDEYRMLVERVPAVVYIADIGAGAAALRQPEDPGDARLHRRGVDGRPRARGCGRSTPTTAQTQC